MNTTINASTPDQLNAAAEAVIGEATPAQSVVAEITPPSDTLVTLPGGFVNSAGEVVRVAEVRELTGRDEELVSKSSNMARALHTILNQAVVKLGNEKPTEQQLDQLLVGDRDAILLGIYRATFGPTAEISCWCSGCAANKTVEVNVDRDIEVNRLLDPIREREFTVKGRKHEYQVVLPTGTTARSITDNLDSKTVAELQTLLLEQTVTEIDGNVVLSKSQIQNLGLADRRKIQEQITERSPGPQFSDVKITCPDCEGEVVVPINLGALFRF